MEADGDSRLPLPKFSSAEYMPKAAPLPIFIIQPSGDEYTSAADDRRLFGLANEPKQFRPVMAGNDHFKGSEREFF